MKERTEGKEPILSSNSSLIEIAKAMNWYVPDNKERKDWFISRNKKHEEIKHFKSLPDYCFSTVGLFARMMDQGLVLPDNMQESYDERVTKLVSVKSTKSVAPAASAASGAVTKTKVKTDKLDAYIADIEYEIDTFLANDCKTKFNPEYFIKSSQLNIGSRYQLRSWFKELHAELDLLVNTSDKELKECYSFLTKHQQKRYLAFIDSIVNAAVSTKSTKPRKVKIITPAKRVKDFKYMKEGSIAPELILGANELWTWNSKERKVTLYESNAGFDIKGTTIQNIDTAETKMVRQPEIMKTFTGTQKKMKKRYNELTTKATKTTGRISAKITLLKVF